MDIRQGTVYFFVQSKRKGVNVYSKNTKELRGWCLNDEVACFGKRGWISGFTGISSAYIVDGDGQYIQMPNKNYKQVTLNNVTRICHNNIWRYFVT